MTYEQYRKWRRERRKAKKEQLRQQHEKRGAPYPEEEPERRRRGDYDLQEPA